jgi:cytidylate kinase
MAIITISRGSYSMGKEVAEKVAVRLGYECISREVILDASKYYHIPEIKLSRAIHDAPSILNRISGGKQKYIAYIMSAFADRVAKDNIVYHGMAGHLLLTDVKHALKVRIIARLDYRIAIVAKRDNITSNEARALLIRDDQERQKWTKSLYTTDPADSSLYDLVININKLTKDHAVDFICQAATYKELKTTESSMQKVKDLALACRIKAVFLEQGFDVSVTSDYGNILVYTKAGDRLMNKLQTIVKGLDGKIKGINNIEIHSGVTAPHSAV